jgi:hypothetical protein
MYSYTYTYLDLSLVVSLVALALLDLLVGHRLHAEPVLGQGHVSREHQVVHRHSPHHVLRTLHGLVADGHGHEVPLHGLPVEGARVLAHHGVGEEVGLHQGFQALDGVLDGLQLLLCDTEREGEREREFTKSIMRSISEWVSE